jgi:hypothetical protein
MGAFTSAILAPDPKGTILWSTAKQSDIFGSMKSMFKTQLIPCAITGRRDFCELRKLGNPFATEELS